MMKEYSIDGTIMAEGNYVDGKQDGDWKYSIGEYFAEISLKEKKMACGNKSMMTKACF
ncbi:MAG: hypothetical protein IPI10_14400 [Bacteroidetes bacterium]|nr:hypothetical protein [Bacteroidota bacterium]